MLSIEQLAKVADRGHPIKCALLFSLLPLFSGQGAKIFVTFTSLSRAYCLAFSACNYTFLLRLFQSTDLFSSSFCGDMLYDVKVATLGRRERKGAGSEFRYQSSSSSLFGSGLSIVYSGAMKLIIRPLSIDALSVISTPPAAS